MRRPVRRIDYSRVMRKVGKIRQLSTDLNNESRDLNNVINDIVRIWKGDASKLFISQSEILEDNMESTAEKMDKLADKISSAARSIKREDDQRIHDWKVENSD